MAVLRQGVRDGVYLRIGGKYRLSKEARREYKKYILLLCFFLGGRVIAVFPNSQHSSLGLVLQPPARFASVLPLLPTRSAVLRPTAAGRSKKSRAKSPPPSLPNLRRQRPRKRPTRRRVPLLPSPLFLSRRIRRSPLLLSLSSSAPRLPLPSGLPSPYGSILSPSFFFFFFSTLSHAAHLAIPR